MSGAPPVAIRVQDGRDLGYAAVPEAVIERLRDRLVAGPLARAVSAAVLTASELNLCQLREGAAVWEPDKATLTKRLLLSEHPAREAVDALERAGMIGVQRGRWDGTTRLPNRIALQPSDDAFCAVTRRAIAAIVERCQSERRSRAHALAVYVTLVWLANQQRAEHTSEPRKRATVSYPKMAALCGVSEPQTRRVVKDLMVCGVLQDVTAPAKGPRTAKTWRLVEPPAAQAGSNATPGDSGLVSRAPRSDLTSATARSHERDRPITGAPPSALRSATSRSGGRDGPITGAPSRAREGRQQQHSAGQHPINAAGEGPVGEGDRENEAKTAAGDAWAVMEAMIAMLTRRAGGHSNRARRRSQDPSWAAAADELLADGYSVDELTALMELAETDLAVGHRITCLPSFNAHLDALQARRSAARDRPAATGPQATVDALVEVIARTLRQAPPRATRLAHLEIARELDAPLADEHGGFLTRLPWHELGQRDQATLRHAILDLWRAHDHRRAA